MQGERLWLIPYLKKQTHFRQASLLKNKISKGKVYALGFKLMGGYREMIKKILFAMLIVFVLLISARAEEDPAADPSKQLQQARTYQKDGYSLEAEQI